MTGPLTVRRVPTVQLTGRQIDGLRALLWAAFDDPDPEERFTEEDWAHALGGTHFLKEVDGRIVSHAAVVERDIRVRGQPLRTGYVEAVATAPDGQGKGYGTAVMRDVGRFIDDRYELGALGTGLQGFYERLGWEVWRGPSFVRTNDGEQATPDEDGYIMVRRTPATPPLDVTAPISCEWRPGDVW